MIDCSPIIILQQNLQLYTFQSYLIYSQFTTFSLLFSSRSKRRRHISNPSLFSASPRVPTLTRRRSLCLRTPRGHSLPHYHPVPCLGVKTVRFQVPMRSKSGDSSELGDEDSATHPAEVTAAPSLLVSIELNELGIEEEADDDTPPKLEISPKKETVSSPEENKNPDDARELNHRDKSSSFTPPPALSPAHPKTEPMEVEDEEVEEEEEEERKPPTGKKTFAKPSTSAGLRKVESSPAMMRLEKEKKTSYKKKDKSKEGVPAQDPNAPKRNRSAYVHFIISRRSAYSKATMSQSNININLAADWQKLSAEDRKPYHKLAEEEKTKYIELMEAYKKTDSHKEFQKKRAQFLKASNSRKRKNEDSDEDQSEKKQMDFPKTSTFCPLLDESTSSATSSGSLQYAGPIFTPEFVSYNKTRDSYRRQLTIERSKLEHELEALNTHEEVKLQKQKDRIREMDEKTSETMKTMRSVLSSVAEAKDHLSDIDSLSTWLQSLGKRPTLRKKLHEALAKGAKK